MAKRITFRKMLGLLQRNNEYRQFFSDELLLGVFWEETKFTNTVQLDGAVGKEGLGFGQVQESTLPLINGFFSNELKIPMNWKRSDVATDDRSVQVASRLLYAMMLKNPKTGKAVPHEEWATVQTTLSRYAGVGEADAGLSTDVQMGLIQGWLECERLLKQMNGDFRDTESVRNALRRATRGKGVENHVFLPTFPLMGKKFYYSWGDWNFGGEKPAQLERELALLGADPADDISIHTSCLVVYGKSVKLPGDPLSTDTQQAGYMGVPIVAAKELARLINVDMPETGAQTNDAGRAFLAKLPPLE